MKFKTLESNSPSAYAFSLLVSAAAFMLTSVLTPRLQNAPFDVFQGAVVIAALYGGLGPALLTTALSLVALDYFFLPPFNAFSLAMADLLQLCVFGAVAVVISSLSARLKKTTSALQVEVTQRLSAEKEILQISSREQRRLGEDLHDGLCQTLAGLRLISQDLKERLHQDGSKEWTDVQQIESRLAEALAQADLASRGLYPVELDAEGLRAALQELSQKTSALYRVECRFRSTGEVLIEDSATANHLFRIAQEAIINAIKRGRAKRISVQLRERKGVLLLSITDDGIGLYKEKPRDGMGLKIMSYRARLIDAILNVRSRRGGCARVSCRLITNQKKESYDGAFNLQVAKS